MHPALTHLPRETLETLKTSIRPKFNAYFAFTQNLSRTVPNTPHAGFIYPDNSVMSDLTILAALFCEIYQAFEDHSARSDFAAKLAGSADLQEDSGKSSKEKPIKAPMAHSGLHARVDWQECLPTTPSNNII